MFKWFHDVIQLLTSINKHLKRLEATVGKDEKSGEQTFIRTGPRQTR